MRKDAPDETPWWRSKGYWLGLAMLVLGIWQEVKPFVPEAWLPTILAVMGALVALVRHFTRGPISSEWLPQRRRKKRKPSN